MPSTQSAAARVFDIAELFEQIALYAAHDAIASNTWHERLEPLETLSRMRLINQSSNNGILNSSKLQRLLPVTALPKAVLRSWNMLPTLSAANWLIKTQLRMWSGWDIQNSTSPTNKILTISLVDVDNCDIEIGQYTMTYRHIEAFKQTNNYPEASWRTVPFAGSVEFSKIVIEFVHTTFEEESAEMYGEEKMFGGEATLGEVADTFFEVAGRSSAEQRKVLEELVRAETSGRVTTGQVA